MDSRFGIKDFFLLLLLVTLIVIVILAMKQYDRQWEVIQKIQQQGSDQTQQLASISRQLERGLRVIGTVPGSSTQASSQPVGQDPFARITAAEAMPGYARGDWYVDSGPNSDKITPLVSGDAFAADVQARVLESLITRDPVSLDFIPLLSESWKITDNTAAYNAYAEARVKEGVKLDDVPKDPKAPFALKISFQMRPGTSFSDGEPVTVDDVIWTFNWTMNPKVEAPRDRAYLGKIRSVTKTAENEVTFEFNEPYFDALLLAGSMNILPKHFYSKYSPEDFNKSTGLLLGSGPYRLEDPTRWAPGQQVQLLRNERYWGVQPGFERLVYRIIDNDLARLTTFRNGDLDYFAAQPEQYQKLLQDKDVQARANHFEYDTAISGYRYIAWNEQRGGKPTRFASKRVRQAMTLLTDRERICREVMLGLATPISGPFNPLGKQFNPNVKDWPFDVAQAKSLLAQEGYKDNGNGQLIGPDGQPFQFKLTYPSGSASYNQIALFLRDTYAKAGITLIPDALDWSVFSDRLKNHDFDAISLGWSAGIEDDIYQMFDSSQIADGGDDFVSYKNPELDKLIEEARRTIDEKKRIPLWWQCHAILHEDQPYTFLFTRKSTVFVDKRIHNVQKIPLGLNDLTEWFVPKASRKWEKQLAMLTYIIRRLLLLFPTLLGTTFVVFLVMGLSPGGVGGALLNQQGTMRAQEAKARREYLEKRYGLDKPLIVQYGRWLNHVSPIGFETNEDGSVGRFKFLKVPDLGYSFSKGRPVVDLVEESLPITLLLNAITIPITYFIAIGTGIYAARRRGGWVDVVSGGIFLALWSIPIILAGVLLIGFLANRQYIQLFPTAGLHDTLADSMPFFPTHDPSGWQRGWLLDACWHLFLPIVCLTYSSFAVLSRLTRGAMLDNLAADYARTAKAKGLTERSVLFRHVFRNSLIPLITVGASILPGLLGGALITENIFSIHGMGMLMIEAIRARDRELILDEALVVGLVGLFSYLLADILYAVADPRVSYT